MTWPYTRRDFILTSLAAAGSVMGAAACRNNVPEPDEPVQPQTAQPAQAEAAQPIVNRTPVAAMPTRSLGRTQLQIPLLGLGGSASPLSRAGDEAAAIAIIERAWELGVRYFDTAANYGPSEERLGQVLPAHRLEAVLATKTSQRDRDGAWRELERSLQRLQTDHIDLWQFHALTYDWDLDTLLQPQQGAIKAAQEAQEQGIVRFVGVTGHHNPNIIVRAIQQYPFDAALIPINAADRHTPQPFISNVLPVAQANSVGIVAMKVPAYGRLFKPGVLTGMPEAIGYSLSQAGVHSCIIAAETVAQLEENVAAAVSFEPLTASAIADIEQRTAAVWQENSFFRNWA